MRLYLIRHGEVENAGAKVVNGQLDTRLSAEGERQLMAVAARLRAIKLDAVLCSDLQRARFGAAAIAAGREFTEQAAPIFREQFFGDWQGKTHNELSSLYNGLPVRQLMRQIERERPHNGESVFDLWSRCTRGLEKILRQYKQADTVALVAHAGVNRCIISHILCSGPQLFWQLEQNYACLNIIEFRQDEAPDLLLFNSPTACTR